MWTAFWNGLKLQKKIALGYLLPVLVLVGAAVWGAWIASQVSVNVERTNLVSDLTDKTHHLQIGHLQMSSGLFGFMVDPSPVLVQEFRDGDRFLQETLDLFESERFSVDRLQETFSETDWATLGPLRQDLDGLVRELRADEASDREIFDRLRQGDREGALELFRARPEAAQIRSFAAINQQLHDIYQDLVLSEQVIVESALRQLVRGAIFVAVVLGGFLAVAVGAISSGAAQAIRRAIASIASATSGIANTVEDRERASRDRAAAVSQVTATITELDTSSQQSAERALQAENAAKDALSLVEKGDLAATEILTSMETLNAEVETISAQVRDALVQNEQIGTISQLVGNLSNQTNMLALNASVEAVRAGEQGRGFAVVAAEIRKLADESKRSAERIGDLVAAVQQATQSTASATETAVRTVERSAAIARETAELFAGVRSAVDSVSLGSQQIARNLQEQAAAMQQVSQAMTALDREVQDTARGIAQTRDDVLQLQQASQNLERMV